MNTDAVSEEFCRMWKCKEIVRCDKRRCIILRESIDMALEYGMRTVDEPVEEAAAQPLL